MIDILCTFTEAFDVVFNMSPEEVLDAPDDIFLDSAFQLLEEDFEDRGQ